VFSLDGCYPADDAGPYALRALVAQNGEGEGQPRGPSHEQQQQPTAQGPALGL